MRVFLAMLSHETNTFSNVPTDRVQFEARGLSYGGEIVEGYRGTGTCLGGMIGAAERLGMTLLPSVAATASPAGLVTRDIYQHVKQRMLTDLEAAGRLDGVLLDLHGAMVPEGVDDGEGDIIAAVRQAVGPDVPIAVTLDFHGNLGRDMIAGADLLHGYKTYPHVDMAERGVEAAERLAQVIAGRLKPTAAWRKPPLMPPLGRQGTARGPMRRLYDLADEMERDPKVISISLFAGFPYADIPDAGLGVYVVTDDDKALAERLADQLARVAWEHRHEFIHTALPVKEAVAAALAAEGRPIVLADMADNTGGGAAGDGTEILRELLRVGARSATVACIWDAAAVQACVKAGVGALRDPRRRRQGGRPARRAGARDRHRAHALRRTLHPPRADDERPAGPARDHRGTGRERRKGDTHLLPLADARPGDDPVRRDRPPQGENPGREVHHPLPRGLRADRQGDHRGRRAGVVFIQPRAFRVRRVRRPIFPLDPDTVYEPE